MSESTPERLGFVARLRRPSHRLAQRQLTAFDSRAGPALGGLVALLTLSTMSALTLQSTWRHLIDALERITGVVYERCRANIVAIMSGEAPSSSRSVSSLCRRQAIAARCRMRYSSLYVVGPCFNAWSRVLSEGPDLASKYRLKYSELTQSGRLPGACKPASIQDAT